MNGNRADIQTRFGVAVRKRRTEKELTQQTLAFRANLHRTYITDVERGERNVSLRAIHAIVTALECAVGELLSPPYFTYEGETP